MSTVGSDGCRAPLTCMGLHHNWSWQPSTETRTECEASSPANGSVPDSEAIVRIPARMIPMIREACDAVERAQLR
ncbi:hypothetical protein [Streptomyces sp. NPDC001108]